MVVQKVITAIKARFRKYTNKVAAPIYTPQYPLPVLSDDEVFMLSIIQDRDGQCLLEVFAGHDFGVANCVDTFSMLATRDILSLDAEFALRIKR